MAYRIEIVRSAAKEIESVGRLTDRRRIVARIASLADEPRPPGCTRLSGRAAYRIRQGDYRILYTVADEVRVVSVVKVATGAMRTGSTSRVRRPDRSRAR